MKDLLVNGIDKNCAKTYKRLKTFDPQLKYF